MPEALMIALDKFDLRRVRRSSSKSGVIHKKVSTVFIAMGLTDCANVKILKV